MLKCDMRFAKNDPFLPLLSKIGKQSRIALASLVLLVISDRILHHRASIVPFENCIQSLTIKLSFYVLGILPENLRCCAENPVSCWVMNSLRFQWSPNNIHYLEIQIFLHLYHSKYLQWSSFIFISYVIWGSILLSWLMWHVRIFNEFLIGSVNEVVHFIWSIGECLFELGFKGNKGRCSHTRLIFATSWKPLKRRASLYCNFTKKRGYLTWHNQTVKHIMHLADE